MMKITIVAVGKMKKKYFTESFQEYLKMISPYMKVDVREIPSESFDQSNKEKIKKIEGEKIEKVLDKYSSGKIILLDENGKEYSSHEMADLLKDSEESHIIFVVAGTLGYSKELKEKYRNKMSLSKMTFPHELARVMLIEQLYRSASIISGKKYHY